MKYLACTFLVATAVVQGQALCCTSGDTTKCDSTTWKSAFGDCNTYFKNAPVSNYGFCGTDTDVTDKTLTSESACPVACDNCSPGETRSPTAAPTLNCSSTDATCCDDPSFWSGYGDCSSYTSENYSFCQTDKDAAGVTALEACKNTCNNCPNQPSRSPTSAPTLACDATDRACCNDPSWASPYGDCATYVSGTTNFLNCASDSDNGRYAYQACPVSCGVCNGATPTFPTNAPTSAAPTTPAPTTSAPTNARTPAPTSAPTNAVTSSPTNATTPAPTDAQTPAPTNATTPSPTDARTSAPTNATTSAPTRGVEPTNAPVTRPPTDEPVTRAPNTRAPTDPPTNRPTRAPINATPSPTRAPIANDEPAN